MAAWFKIRQYLMKHTFTNQNISPQDLFWLDNLMPADTKKKKDKDGDEEHNGDDDDDDDDDELNEMEEQIEKVVKMNADTVITINRANFIFAKKSLKLEIFAKGYLENLKFSQKILENLKF
jgi:hypothetical protein